MSVGDRQLEELPLALRLNEFSGKLGGPGRVGERDKPYFLG